MTVATNDDIDRLSARLPEVEWKLLRMGAVLNATLLPQGLFRHQLEYTPKSCVDEIRADLATLKSQNNEQATCFLAQQVLKKINVLVRLCQQKLKKKTSEQQVPMGIHAISTRQQWLQTLQNDIDRLTDQQQALLKTLTRLQSGNDVQALLQIQAELGDAERCLTLAKETLVRSTMY